MPPRRPLPRKRRRPKPAPPPRPPRLPPAPIAAASPAAKAPHALPFHGKVGTVDAKAKSFTVPGKEKEQTYKIVSTTVITKAGQPGTIKDVVANEEVRGSFLKSTDGTNEVKTLKVGPLTDAEKAEKEAKKQKREEKKAAKEGAAPEASPKP